MSDFNLEQYFSGTRLNELFRSEAVKRGVPDPLPAELASVSPNSPVGTMVQWDEVTGNRKLAVLVNQGASSRTQEVQGVTRRFATALGSKEDFIVGQQLLYQLKNNIPLMAEAARRELVNKISNFRTRMDNLAKAVRHSTFALGHIYADASGNILPSSSGATVDVNMNVATANKITKNGSGSTYTIGDWSSVSVDIPGYLRNLRIANTKANGYRLSTILYGSDLPGFMFQNTQVQAYLARNPMLNSKVLDTNEIPDGFLGWKWKPVSEAFFDDQNSVTRSWFASNFIGAMPDVSPDWYEYFECGTLIPQGLGVPNMSLEDMLANVAVAYGLFSYAEMGTNPIALKTILGWYGLSVIKVPGTYYFGTCS